MAYAYAHLPNQQRIIEDAWNEENLENQDNDFQVNLDEIRPEVNILLNHEDDIQGQIPLPPNEDAFNAFFRGINALGDDPVARECCPTCTTTEIVDDVRKFRRGQHITMPGNMSTTYFEKFKTLVNLYEHHAIVNRVISTEGTLVEMEIIHFTENEGVVMVYRERKNYDLRTKKICVVYYDKPRYNTEEILARAESMVGRTERVRSYNMLCNNCEHFVTWCITGEGESFQVQGLKSGILNAVFNLPSIGGNIERVITRILLYSADEVAVGLSAVGPNVAFGGAAAIYLLYCIFKTVAYFKDRRKGRRCWSCVKEKLKALWLKFSLFGISSVISFVIFQFAIPLMISGAGIPIAILLILLSVGLQMAVPTLQKALFCPFKVKSIPVNNLNMLHHGDVITYRYYGVSHTVIVSDIDEELHRLRVIHYGRKYVFGTKSIVEEYTNFASKKNVFLLDCNPINSFSRDVVVSRARSRIGETKWELVSNRSDHFAFWAKVRPFDEEETEVEVLYDEGQPLHVSPARVSLYVKTKEIYRLQDLQIGDVVETFLIDKLNRVGILSSIRYLDDSNDRIFEIEVIIYGYLWTVMKKRVTINLNTDRLFVQVYNAALCCDMEQRARNAREILGETGKWWTTRGFIEHCIERN